MSEGQSTNESSSPTESAARTEYRFEAEVDEVLKLVIHSLYSNRDVFLRELVSNAADALDKLRFRAVTDASLLASDAALSIKLEPDAAAGTLAIVDNGVGMSRADLEKNLGTIARSGTREFVKALEDAKRGEVTQIGQFGVGFYSAFLVADEVSVTSRAAGSSEAFTWRSRGAGSFTIEPATRAEQGSTVVLHLKPDALEYLRGEKLTSLVRAYSDFVAFPIELAEPRENEGDAGYRKINRGTALWQRRASEVTEVEYQEFYKHLTHDWEEARLHRHFRAEGTTEFSGLLFVPKNAPMDLFAPDANHGLRLYVKRVFIVEDANALLPRWLRFVRGVIDSEDLPLNVSRESLQDSRIVQTIRKQVTKQVLDALDALAENDAESYDAFYSTFGMVLKEGFHFDPDQKVRLAKLVRFDSTTSGTARVSLATVKGRMKEGQKELYFALGESRGQLEKSPLLEGFRARGVEVLLLSDAVDHWAMAGLGEFDGVKLVNVSEASRSIEELPLVSGEAPKESDAASEGAVAGLIAGLRAALAEHVAEVRTSKVLVDSPAVLVQADGGIAPHLERLLRAAQPDLPTQKRILEINATHPLVTALASIVAGDAARAGEWADLLYGQALLAEGSPLPDSAGFAAKLASLMTRAAQAPTV